MSMSSSGLMYYVALTLIVLLVRGCGRRLDSNWIILLGSWLIYFVWEPRFFGLLLLSTVVDYSCALGIQRGVRVMGGRKGFLALSVATNLGILFTFKYLDFFALSAQALLIKLGLQVEYEALETAIPIGISFYTFQTLGYTIDVYRQRIRAEKNLMVFACYVSFFPQLAAGPIERPSKLIPQLRRARKLDWSTWNSGLQLLGRGLMEKFVFAGNLSRLVDHAFSNEPAKLAAVDIYCAAFAFMAQLYFDLSGYTNIARGSARLMGIDLSVNFRAPFWARSPSAFWARWHISVTGWFQTYVAAAFRERLSGVVDARWIIIAVTVLIGLWHGPQWTFVLFGLYHGIWLIVSRRVVSDELPKRWVRFRLLCRWLTFVHLLALSGLIFRSPSVGYFLALLYVLVQWPTSTVPPVKSSAAHFVCLLGFGLALAGQWWFETRRRPKLSVLSKSLLYVFATLVFVLFGVFDASEYIYIQF